MEGNSKSSTGFDHRQHHLKAFIGLEGMGDVGGENDAFPVPYRVRRSTDDDFGRAVQQLDQRLMRRAVFRQPFALVEGKQRDVAGRLLHDHLADHRSIGIVDGMGG